MRLLNWSGWPGICRWRSRCCPGCTPGTPPGPWLTSSARPRPACSRWKPEKKQRRHRPRPVLPRPPRPASSNFSAVSACTGCHYRRVRRGQSVRPAVSRGDPAPGHPGLARACSPRRDTGVTACMTLSGATPATASRRSRRRPRPGLHNLIGYYQHTAARAESMLARQTLDHVTGWPRRAPGGGVRPGRSVRRAVVGPPRTRQPARLSRSRHAGLAGPPRSSPDRGHGRAAAPGGPWAEAITRHTTAVQEAKRVPATGSGRPTP